MRVSGVLTAPGSRTGNLYIQLIVMLVHACVYGNKCCRTFCRKHIWSWWAHFVSYFNPSVTWFGKLPLEPIMICCINLVVFFLELLGIPLPISVKLRVIIAVLSSWWNLMDLVSWPQHKSLVWFLDFLIHIHPMYWSHIIYYYYYFFKCTVFYLCVRFLIFTHGHTCIFNF